mgnify:CR=1 FL=1|tara:strand:- start:2032 stop:2193 length:162 start_codon:yes stop_codon:yes gene_type:complete
MDMYSKDKDKKDMPYSAKAGYAKGGMSKKGYAKGGMTMANCGASKKPMKAPKK